jgi:hypothetical protein
MNLQGVHSQNIILSFLVILFAMADSQKRRQVGQGGIEDHWFLSGLFMADVQCNRFAWRVCAIAMVVQSL